jgi:prolyl oligopeptidase
MKNLLYLFIINLSFVLIMNAQKQDYPKTEKKEITHNLHGIDIKDNYEWLENAKDIKVQQWTDEQDKYARNILDKLPQKNGIIKRLNELSRYDDEGVPNEVQNGKRIFYYSKKKDDEKWVYNTKADENSKGIEIFNPNKWDKKQTLDQVLPSRDGKYLAFGKAESGNENPVIQIMEIETQKVLDDKLLGQKQGVNSWMPDNSGFFYSARPLKGEVPAGEEYYWQSVYFHKLGTPAKEDKKVFYDDKVKEYFHGAGVSEDGKYVLYYRSKFYKNEVYISKIDNFEKMIPIVTGFDASYGITEMEGKLFIVTDKDAPMQKVYVTDVDKPERENWKEFIPETKDNLAGLDFINGKIYVTYTHNAYTLIKIYTFDGKYIRDLELPTLGNAGIGGYWNKQDVWVNFSSFIYPSTTFKYNFEKNELKLFHKPPVDVNVKDYIVEQEWYNSKDGTKVSMFLIHNKNMNKDGNNPVYLTGYGGFNVSQSPRFSNLYVTWLEAGGMIAVPNLRGGGEYGKTWHEDGMKEKKQNVFDDFIGAAEYLIDNKYTSKEKLCIGGGSNGGLLTGAALVQRPDLFKAVYIGVPLLDMVRYHKFGLANIWAEEYGNADNPDQFKYIYKYSPYHNIKKDKYPSVILTGSEDDARVDPMHARKMTALLQESTTGNNPIICLIRRSSGHGGGTTISMQIEQTADIFSFLMDQIGMNTK